MVFSTEPITQIVLNSTWIAVLGTVIALAIYRGRPEWLLGLHLSTTLWARTLIVGGVSGTWIILAGLILATLHYAHSQRGIRFTPIQMRDNLGWMPDAGRWIVLWMVLWWSWIFLVLGQFEFGSKITVLRPLLLNIILPIPIMLLLASDLRRLRGFAIAYVVASVIGCWFALNVYGIGFTYLLSDPALTGTGLIRLGIANYHFFSHFCAIAFILSMALYLNSRNVVAHVLYLGSAAWCAYFLLLSGARQSMSGAVAIALLFLIWTLVRGGRSVSIRGLLLVLVIALIVFWLYQIAPELIVREDEANLDDSFNIFADRSELWLVGWGYFLASPIWGFGFEQTIWSHNIFIGTLADQGAVGMIFFIGYLVFAISQIPHVIRRAPHDERGLWRMAFFGIFLFGIIHGQASGNTSSTAHLYWPIAALWWLSQPELHTVQETVTAATGALRQRVARVRSAT